MTALLDPEPPGRTNTKEADSSVSTRSDDRLVDSLLIGNRCFRGDLANNGFHVFVETNRSQGSVIERAKFGQTLLRRIPGLKANSGLFNLPIRIHIATPTSDELQSLRRLTGLISIHLTEGRIDEPFCELLESLPFLSTLSVRKFDLTDENLSRMIKSIHNPPGSDRSTWVTPH